MPEPAASAAIPAEESPGDLLNVDAVVVDMPAPPGWRKKFAPKKGGTPRRNEVIFIAPTGEEIRSKKQLDAYLKSHPGGPSSSSFDWSTGDTPRRSARLNERLKGAETPPEEERPKKRGRKSGPKYAAVSPDAKVEDGDAEAKTHTGVEDAEDKPVAEDGHAETKPHVGVEEDVDMPPAVVAEEDRDVETKPHTDREEDEDLPPAAAAAEEGKEVETKPLPDGEEEKNAEMKQNTGHDDDEHKMVAVAAEDADAGAKSHTSGEVEAAAPRDDASAAVGEDQNNWEAVEGTEPPPAEKKKKAEVPMQREDNGRDENGKLAVDEQPSAAVTEAPSLLVFAAENGNH